MSRKRARRDRHPVRRGSDPVARARGSFRQEEFFPETIEVQAISAFTGPIPPPHLLSEYEQILVGLADRIVGMAEGEAEHRRQIQRRRMRLAEGGLLSAFVISMTAIVGGQFLVHEGASREGIGSILAALAALLVVYLSRGRKTQPAK
jgi:uncharacterized membrane protein